MARPVDRDAHYSSSSSSQLQSTACSHGEPCSLNAQYHRCHAPPPRSLTVSGLTGCKLLLALLVVSTLVVLHWTAVTTLSEVQQPKQQASSLLRNPSALLSSSSSSNALLHGNRVLSYTCNSEKNLTPAVADQHTTNTSTTSTTSSSLDAATRESWYSSKSRAILANGSHLSVTSMLFREPSGENNHVDNGADFDNWGHSYQAVKAGMYHWKSTRFQEILLLRSDNTKALHIYESASGMGLNLYMTLEILAEQRERQEEGEGLERTSNKINILENVIVYGNDFVPESVEIARSMVGPVLPGGATAGRFCTGDSTRLSNVPSNSFDLVYTGYITPMLDPLGLNFSSDANSYKAYVQLCQQDQHNQTTTSMAWRAQENQNAWYAKWVSEMIRLAKPGAPVIVEQVSYPFCHAMFDWGGVAPDFWFNSSSSFGNEIELDSIEIENDTIFRKRYHVFMRKKKKGPV